jgi:hypothetical protein
MIEPLLFLLLPRLLLPSLAPQSYAYPVSMVSPPILLQTRLESTETCKNEMGTVYLGKIWNDTVFGVMCESPYECDEDIRNDSTALMSCSRDSTAPSFFGQTPLVLGGKLSFFEFLQSITDAPILVRNGTFDTSTFLDAQTTSVTIAMVCFRFSLAPPTPLSLSPTPPLSLSSSAFLLRSLS